MTIYVIGSGNHAKQVLAVAKRCGIQATLYTSAFTPTLLATDRVIIGYGNSSTRDSPGLSARTKLYEQCREAVDGFIDPSAVVLGNVYHSVQVFPHAVVNLNAHVGDNVLINTGAIIEHDCRVGAHCHIAPGAVLLGRVQVGPGTHIGAGAVVKQGVKIGAGCIIAMGARVRDDVHDGGCVF